VLLYLDICCFNRPFDDQSQVRILLETEAKLAIQERIRLGTLRLAWSYMMDFENEANPFMERKLSISNWRNIATVDISSSKELISRARRINEIGFKAKDSIHLACAMEAGCAKFLTTDTGILKRAALISGLEIMNPVDYDFNTL
jgi:predicted nucleic acid-binding protein